MPWRIGLRRTGVVLILLTGEAAPISYVELPAALTKLIRLPSADPPRSRTGIARSPCPWCRSG